MKQLIVAVLFIISNSLIGQKNLCDTTKYYFYSVKVGDSIPNFDCNTYIVNEVTLKRFEDLSKDYALLLKNYYTLDSIYNSLVEMIDKIVKKQ